MALFSSTQPSLRARLLPKFPVRVLAGNGITITKTGLNYTIAANAIDNLALNQLADIATDRILGRDSAGSGSPEQLTVGTGIGFSGAGGLVIAQPHRLRIIPITYFTPAVLATNSKADFYVPWTCTLRAVTLLADVSGSIVIDIWKDTFANYPPTVADTITASAKPTLSSAIKVRDTTLTGWTTAFTAGDTLRFNVDSVTTIARIMCLLEVELP